jgi:hypothetical protein
MEKLNGCDESLENVIGVPATTVDPFAGLRKFSTTPSAPHTSMEQRSDSEGPSTACADTAATDPVAMIITVLIALTRRRRCECSISRSYTACSTAAKRHAAAHLAAIEGGGSRPPVLGRAGELASEWGHAHARSGRNATVRRRSPVLAFRPKQDGAAGLWIQPALERDRQAWPPALPSVNESHWASRWVRHCRAYGHQS